MSSASDWLSRSNEEFVRQYAPHAAAKSYGLPRPLMTPAPSTPLSRPVAQIGPHSGAPAQPSRPHSHPQKEYNMTQFDFANLPPQIDRRLAIQTLMSQPQDTVVNYAGRQMLVSDALHHMLNGDDAVTVHIPANTAGRLGPNDPGRQPGTPGQLSAGPRIQISQAATDALSEAQYAEFQRTGGIEGLTGPIEGTRVHVRNSSGAVQSRFSFDPESGKVGPGRPLDMRYFTDPNADGGK